MKLTTRAAYAVLPGHLWSAIFEELALIRRGHFSMFLIPGRINN
jgi:hypothetical protein